MSITNYTPNKCGYRIGNLKKVVYLFSSATNDVYIDNGEAYVLNENGNFQRLSGTAISFNEVTNHDYRYKFTKTVSVTVDGFANLSRLSGKYYVVLEDEYGLFWLVNYDFPSLVTYTYTLEDGVEETEFTFQAVSNFPTLKFNVNMSKGADECKTYRLVKVDSLKVLDKKHATISESAHTVYGYSNSVYKTVDFLKGSCSLTETFDGMKVSTSLSFGVDMDAYKSSWQYNLDEYKDNKYVAVVDNHLACGFEMGLLPSYNAQGLSDVGQYDTFVITLSGSSQNGSIWANSWSEESLAPIYTWRVSDEWTCTPTIYRWWVNPDTTDYACVGVSKHYMEYYQYSTDDGETWKNVVPQQSRTSDEVIEAKSVDCGYVEGSAITYTATAKLAETNSYNDTDSAIRRNAFMGVDGSISITNHTFEDGVGRIEFSDDVIGIRYYAFANCSGLTSINIPQSCDYIGSMAFYKCVNLRSVSLNDGLKKIGGDYIENYLTVGSTFRGCYSLSSVTIPDSVESIYDQTFVGCSAMTSAYIGSGVTTLGAWIFDGNSLTSATITAVNVPSRPTRPLEFYGPTFNDSSGCPIYVPCESVYKYRSYPTWDASRVTGIPPCTNNVKLAASSNSGQYYEIEFDGSTELTSGNVRTIYAQNSSHLKYVVGDGVTSIGASAFDAEDIYYGVDSVYLPDSVTSIGARAFRYASYGVSIPSGVTSIGASAFEEANMESVTIPASVQYIGNRAFYSVNNILSEMTCLATTPPTLGGGLFYTQSPIIRVPCESIDAYRAAWSQYAAYISPIPPCEWTPSNYKLYLKYRNGDMYIPPCDSSTTISSGDTRPNRFYTNYMTELHIGDCITTVGARAARDFNGLTAITISDSVTTIDAYAFSCSYLKKLDIGSNITSIGNNNWFNTNSNLVVTITALTPPTLGSNIEFTTTKTTIYVPQTSLNAYKTASGWSSYASIIQPIPE